jgi:hypothetical protein
VSATLLCAVLTDIPREVELFTVQKEEGSPPTEAKTRFVEVEGDPSKTLLHGIRSKHRPASSGSSGRDALARTQIVDGVATLIWEWIANEPRAASIEVAFPVFVVHPGVAKPEAIRALGQLGPQSAVGTASSDDPIPRFAEAPSARTIAITDDQWTSWRS